MLIRILTGSAIALFLSFAAPAIAGPGRVAKQDVKDKAGDVREKKEHAGSRKEKARVRRENFRQHRADRRDRMENATGRKHPPRQK